jgi:putative DNA primase/helicase
MRGNVQNGQLALDRKVARLPGRPRGRPDPDWTSKLTRSGNDAFLGDHNNVMVALREAPQLCGLVRLDQFKQEQILARSPPWREAAPGEKWRETDDVQLAAFLQKLGLRVRSTETVASCLAVVAEEHGFHPVRDELQALAWDGEPRLDTWLVDYLGATGSPQYLKAVGRKFLISSVARIMRPGCKADHVLVLEGKQGIGKSTAAAILAGRTEWFAGNLPDVHHKDAALQLVGRRIVEISELNAVRRGQLEAVKSFITQTEDTLRLPYGRRTVQLPRQCVMVATTNERCYLRDHTGNRRFWPVHITRVDIERLKQSVSQLWAETYVAFSAGEAWHLSAEETHLAEIEQCERVVVSEIAAMVHTYLDQLTCDHVTVYEVMVYGLRMSPDDQAFTERTKRLGPEVAEAITRAGWEYAGRKGKARHTTYHRRVDKGDI